MKKKLFVLTAFILILSILASCSNAKTDTVTSSTEANSAETTTLSQLSTTGANEITTDISDKDSGNDSGGGVIQVQKYRQRFYTISAPFVACVGRKECDDWLETVDFSKEVMVMKLFVEHFNISREDFDKANLELAKRIKNGLDCPPCVNPKDYANQEDDEIYNADIIYTFDDDIIREYYLTPDYPYIYDFEFEEAVEKGEYKSQTEEWVDLEALEAEVVAKYGNIEYETKSMEKLENIYES